MNQSIQDLFTQAYQLHQEGQLQQAIALYEQLLASSPHSIQVLHYLALANAQLGNMALAEHFFAKVLQLEDLHVPTHINLAKVYAQQGKYMQALQQYRLAVHIQPECVEAHYYLGLLLLKMQKLSAAKTQFNNVMALCPHHIPAQFYLGLLFLEEGAYDAAQEAFEKILKAEPEHVEALVNLGVVALRKEQNQQAIHYFTQALALNNEHIEARNNLAATFMHFDRFENAQTHYEVLLLKDPENIEYLYNMGVAQMALGHVQEATQHFNTILNHDSKHFDALTNLAAIYNRLDKAHEAIACLQQALQVRPQDETTQFMLNALTGKGKGTSPCTPYITNLFNNYALYYDQHMQAALQYSLPSKITQVLHQLNPETCLFNRVLDLGCGTGLIAEVLRKISTHLTGVDIATNMLKQAREKKIYDTLVESDIVTYLTKDTSQYNLIVAAEVLPYFSELDTLWQQIALHLTDKGLFIFSIEISPNSPWTLQKSARFSHHPDYIQAKCISHGFQIIYQEKINTRLHKNQPLYEMLFVIQYGKNCS